MTLLEYALLALSSLFVIIDPIATVPGIQENPAASWGTNPTGVA
jgi:hypothetical protein